MARELEVQPAIMIMNKYFSILSVYQMLTLFSRSSTSTEEGTGAADTVTRKSVLVTKKNKIFLENLLQISKRVA